MRVIRIMLVVALAIGGVALGAALTEFLRAPTNTVVEPIELPDGPGRASDDDRRERQTRRQNDRADKEPKERKGAVVPQPAPAGDDDVDDDDGGDEDGD